MSTLSTTNLKNPSSGSNNVVLNTDGSTTIAAPSNIIKSGTFVPSTSGTSIDFTGIPSWVKRVTVMFNGVRTSGTSALIAQLGTTSAIATSGYTGGGMYFATSAIAGITTISGIPITGGMLAANTFGGLLTIVNITANAWSGSGSIGGGPTISAGNAGGFGGGSVTLSGTLERVRITTVNGTDTFAAGSINILYEG